MAVAEALMADRPYRGALPIDDVLTIVRRDADTKLDGDVVDALEDVLPGSARTPAPVATVGAPALVWSS